jgi:hypothetical protein
MHSESINIDPVAGNPAADVNTMLVTLLLIAPFSVVFSGTIFTKSLACPPNPASVTVTVVYPPLLVDVAVVKALAVAVFVRRIGVMSLYTPPLEFCM